jgi:hypothetical protein
MGIVATFFLKRTLRRVAKNMDKNINQQQDTFYNNTTNNNYSQHKTSETLKDKGEYVDFEEIKE